MPTFDQVREHFKGKKPHLGYEESGGPKPTDHARLGVYGNYRFRTFLAELNSFLDNDDNVVVLPKYYHKNLKQFQSEVKTMLNVMIKIARD